MEADDSDLGPPLEPLIVPRDGCAASSDYQFGTAEDVLGDGDVVPTTNTAGEAEPVTATKTVTKKKFKKPVKLSVEDALAKFKSRAGQLLFTVDAEGTPLINADSHEITATMRKLYFDSVEHSPLIGDYLTEIRFPVVAVRFLEEIARRGYFADNHTWYTAYSLFSLLLCFSDASEAFCMALHEKEFEDVLISNLSHEPYLDALASSANVGQLVKMCAGICNNMGNYVKLHKRFLDLNAVSICQNILLKIGENTSLKLMSLKFSALLFVAKILKDEDAAEIADKTNCIPKIVKAMTKAMDDTNCSSGRHRYHGFSASELAHGLSMLAVNDDNKMAIYEAGALPVLFPMLTSEDRVEKKAALKCIWQCSFQPGVREEILCNEDYMGRLRHLLEQDEDKDLRHEAAGALWVIEQKVVKKDETKGHVFISYNWKHQAVLIRLRDAIKAAGYPVWMDIDKMENSVLQSMAEAVENAFLVIICYSEEYKRSNMCRTEAEYTFQRGKNFLPLLMTYGYKPDGWLGIIIGSRLYVDLSLHKHPFDTKSAEAIERIRKTCATEQGGEETPVLHTTGPTTDTPPRNSGGSEKQREVSGWGAVRVTEWLDTARLSSHTQKFSEYDGPLLLALNDMRLSAPSQFYKFITPLVGERHVDVLRLASALSRLLE